MHRDAFFKPQRGHASPPSSQPTPLFLAPLSFPDGRFYDLGEPDIRDVYQWNGNLEAPRWRVDVEAVARHDDEEVWFRVLILWSAVRSDRLTSLHPDRCTAILIATRSEIERYLRHHPFPARCTVGWESICLHFA